MKKFLVALTVLGILTIYSSFAYADGPWPHPVNPFETKSIQPPIVTTSMVPQ